MSKVIETDDLGQLQQIIKDNDCVVVDFAAPAWCVPCRKFAPHFDKASETSDAVFVAVDIDKAPWAQSEYGVMSVPTVQMFCNGEFSKNLQARTVIQLHSEIDNV